MSVIKRSVVRHGFRGGGVLAPPPQPETPVVSQTRTAGTLLQRGKVNPKTGEISQTRPQLNYLRSKVMTRANYYFYHANLSRSQACRLSWAECKQLPSPVKHDFGILNEPERKKPRHFYPTHNYRQAKPPYSRNLKFLTSWAILTATLILISLVLLWGRVINGPNLVPDYETENAYPVYDWIDNYHSERSN